MQLIFNSLLLNKNRKCIILHCSSYETRNVASLVLGAELHFLANGFDHAVSLRDDIERMLGRIFPLPILTNSKCLSDFIFKSSSAREKRLMIDKAVVKEAFGRREIRYVDMCAAINIWRIL